MLQVHSQTCLRAGLEKIMIFNKKNRKNQIFLKFKSDFFLFKSDFLAFEIFCIFQCYCALLLH